MKRFFTAILLGVILSAAVPFVVVAEDESVSLASVQVLLQELIEKVREFVFEYNRTFRFERDLVLGSQGNDVTRLQEFMATNTQFYPEKMITGYYGELTNTAVVRLKNEYGIVEPYFGEKTRNALNALFQERGTFIITAPGFTLKPHQEGLDSSDDEEMVRALALSIHVAVNEVRQQYGLTTLEWNESLAEVARKHSEDQSRDNVELTDPLLLCQYPTIRHEGFVSGIGAKERVSNAGVTYRVVGENIAMVPKIKSRSYSFDFGADVPSCPVYEAFTISGKDDKDDYYAFLGEVEEAAKKVNGVSFVKEIEHSSQEVVEVAIRGWMNSPGHRENILYRDYTDSGIGIVKINEYYIITHNFISR